MASGTVYVIDEFQLDRLQSMVSKADTLDELKHAILEILRALPTEYVT